MLIPTSDELRLRARSLNRALFNPPTLRHRHFDGFIASMQHSGTHWLKYMLGLTLAKLYDLPPPCPHNSLPVAKSHSRRTGHAIVLRMSGLNVSPIRLV